MLRLLAVLIFTCGVLTCLALDYDPSATWRAEHRHSPFGDCIAGGGFIAWIPTTTQSWQCGHWPKS